MRLLTWTVGFMVFLAGLEQARNFHDGWSVVWWIWFGVWIVVGFVVLVTRIVQMLTGSKGAPAPAMPRVPGIRKDIE